MPVDVGDRNPPLQSAEARAMSGEHRLAVPVAAQRKLALVENGQHKRVLRKERAYAAQLDRLGLRLRVRLVPAQRRHCPTGGQRSEERRVGKEGRYGGERDRWRRKWRLTVAMDVVRV